MDRDLSIVKGAVYSIFPFYCRTSSFTSDDKSSDVSSTSDLEMSEFDLIGNASVILHNKKGRDLFIEVIDNRNAVPDI